MTFALDIEAVADGKPIIAVVIGDMGWKDYGDDERHAPGLARKGEVLGWREARPLLDYTYNTGFGAPDCHAIYAWTESHVIYTWQYDGSTGIASAPRNPTPGHVDMVGG